MAILDLLKWSISLLFLASISSSSWPVVEGVRAESRVLIERVKRDNTTFECSPSGPCVPCSYSEKGDEKYHCSETGYRMPHKCIEVKSSLKEVNKEQIAKGKYAGNDETGSGMTTGYKGAESQEQQTLKTEGQNDDTEEREDGNRRGLSETTYALEDGKQTYHKFTSCIPAAEEEKLSVLGFEGIILFLLLICSPVVYYRKKRSFVLPGATRIPTNSRF